MNATARIASQIDVGHASWDVWHDDAGHIIVREIGRDDVYDIAWVYVNDDDSVRIVTRRAGVVVEFDDTGRIKIG